MSMTTLQKVFGAGLIAFVGLPLLFGLDSGSEQFAEEPTRSREEIIASIAEKRLVRERKQQTATISEATEEPAQTQEEAAPQPAAAPAPTTYAVHSVIDGDTFRITTAGGTDTVRLIGVDTPETVHPRKPVECFGREASAEAKRLLSGQRVRLESDPTQGERDRYDRRLAYVFLSGGRMVNELMIRGGYAHEYTYDLPYHYQARFRAAERAARAAKAGLWADGVCEPEPVAAPAPTPAPTAAPLAEPEPASLPSSGYVCTSDAYNCSDFSSHGEAQGAFEACGGVSNDIHGLDRDKDGLACESL